MWWSMAGAKDAPMVEPVPYKCIKTGTSGDVIVIFWIEAQRVHPYQTHYILYIMQLKCLSSRLLN